MMYSHKIESRSSLNRKPVYLSNTMIKILGFLISDFIVYFFTYYICIFGNTDNENFFGSCRMGSQMFCVDAPLPRKKYNNKT